MREYSLANLTLTRNTEGKEDIRKQGIILPEKVSVNGWHNRDSESYEKLLKCSKFRICRETWSPTSESLRHREEKRDKYI